MRVLTLKVREMENKYIIKHSGTALIFIALSFLSASCTKKAKSYTFETAMAKTGSIINSVTATGTLQATTTVQVGTQVSGVIRELYVDFNSVVKKGQLLAQIDKTPLLTVVNQAEATLDDARSEVEFQKAAYDRNKVLLNDKLIAQSDFDQVKYNYDKALSNLKNAKAQYEKAVVNLNYSSIYSPIDGVVLNRAVDQGQTVAASFNTPTLFTIANDLTRMQVEANVDEADIGQVKQGEHVEFNVDAYHDNVFTGEVREVRLQPVVTNNVVTYTVVIDAPNPDKKLMPGMTANIMVYVRKVDDVITIPGKALRFSPDATYLATIMKKNESESGQSYSGLRAAGRKGIPGQVFQRRPTGAGDQQGEETDQAGRQASVWIKTPEGIRKVQVMAGSEDGTNTEIISGLKIDDEVVIAMNSPSKKPDRQSTENRSPFMPQRPGSNTKR
jgi:HlyD family secretion protein